MIEILDKMNEIVNSVEFKGTYFSRINDVVAAKVRLNNDEFVIELKVVGVEQSS